MHAEASAAPSNVLDPCAAAVDLGEPLHERQAESTSTCGAGTEVVEDRSLDPVGHPRPGVLNGNVGAGAVTLCGDDDRRAGWGIRLRVLNEIVDDALEQSGIDVHDRSITVDPQGPVPHIEFGDERIDQSAHICPPAMDDPSGGIEPLEIDH